MSGTAISTFVRTLSLPVALTLCQFASAATIAVTNIADSSPGSLRQALINAQSGDTIVFNLSLPATIALTSGELTLTKNITISGPGANLLAVSRAPNAGNFRIFHVTPGHIVTIQGVTISSGIAQQFQNGGGILNEDSALSVINCTVSGNSSSSTGAGICNSSLANTNSATLRVESSTLNGNHAGDYGGAIANLTGNNPTTVIINNSTLGANIGEFAGGGIYNQAGSVQGTASVTLSNGTLAGNVTQLHGGGIANTRIGNPAATVEIENTILKTGASGANISSSNATVISHGYNLSDDDAAGFLSGPGDLVSTDPMLNPAGLQNNGGPTPTIALLPDSPAVNSGNPNSSARDQRYYLRDGLPDRGAFESNGIIAPLSAVSRKTHGAAGAFDVDLPLAGSVGIECRSGGSSDDHQLIMTFATPVTATSASVTSGIGTVSSANLTGSQVTVNLTGVTSAQQIVLTLFGVSDGANINNTNIPMGILLGDVNGNGTVNATDVSLTKSVIGQPTSSSSFRADVNTSGDINATDTAIVKSRLGTALP